MLVKSFAGTLSVIPLPTKYSTVRVVFCGATPYVLVYKKLDGSIPWSKSPTILYNDEPTLSGFGINSSSAFDDTPAPNWITKVFSSSNFVMNLLGTLFNDSKYGVSPLNSANLAELSSLFSICSNTVSCAKNGT